MDLPKGLREANMDESTIRQWAQTLLCEQFAKEGQFFVPVSSSNRHLHLSRADCDALFGAGHELTKLRDLRQPGQFACTEQLTVRTEKGTMTLRVVGPLRRETQVELSVSDCIKLGLPAVVRLSGDTAATPGAVLETAQGRVTLTKGVIVAARHLHLSVEQGKIYGLKSDDTVRLFVEGERATVFDNVIVRCGDAHLLEAHIDVEEANAALLPKNAICRIERQGAAAACPIGSQTAGGKAVPIVMDGQKRVYGNVIPAPEAPFYATAGGVMMDKMQRGPMPELHRKELMTEADVYAAYQRGVRKLTLSTALVLTPLARDRARQLGMEVE